MPRFIPYQQPQNSGFQQGWNMIMNLYGRKQIGEKAEQQQKQFDAKMAQTQKAFKLTEGKYKAEKDIMAKKIAYDEEFRSKMEKIDLETPEGVVQAKRLIMLYGGPSATASVVAGLGKETPSQTREGELKASKELEAYKAGLKRSVEDEIRIRQASKQPFSFVFPTDQGPVIISQGMPTSGKIAEKELAALRSLEGSAMQLIDTSTKILTDVGNDPALIGPTGWAQRTIDSVGKQLEGLVNKLSGKSKAIANFDPNKYDWKSLSTEAGKSAGIKSRIIKLAYQMARLREPEARQFSDADIQKAIDQIGGGTGSPQQMESVLRNIQLDTIKKLMRENIKVLREPYRPSGLEGATIEAGKLFGLSEEEVILIHIQKYGM
jgi:hypothetical protein